MKTRLINALLIAIILIFAAEYARTYRRLVHFESENKKIWSLYGLCVEADARMQSAANQAENNAESVE